MKKNIKKKNVLYIIFFIILIYFFFINLRDSLFVKKKDRLNILFYNQKTAFYSFGFADGVNYFIPFPADIKVLIPGGFGYYRLGALGKLVELEKKPLLYQKSFSAITSSFLDFYFYPPNNEIFFGKETPSQIFLPTVKQIWISKSNANLFDKTYIFFLFLMQQKNQFIQLTNLALKENTNEEILDEKLFFDRLIGFFYKKTYRNEEDTVQIIYTKKENNASLLANIIEGEGIRVVDLSYQPATTINKCQIIISEVDLSQTARALNRFFDCPITKGKTGAYDIIFKLGKKEEDWRVE
ncbi:hypothetical protein COY89_01175 [Candidatus Roizmanbacteria bacterium CG_4_10_14_0_8_um_filter_36_36]|uniref:LytR/CpsA/Psr regulator C-terminal domain-containing protein n=1 Tax=Candidatus Roizmanbacteria bacterium CG10_big_fil_rev_8_21_14_0_10_36_26 TaxID=1974851 RepID=A0A2M8KKN8_9BACT|nr:MAG: hypothetical protein COY89_01175 [Candidatus Roizmanbacteria bacterium CG_4_10_14_0_8_um_filter_36_36]PJE60478.1 MAG: hypothetical protein COU86_04140 [Candidatus Roizmanbacteria bacterium CG10_big_fil_rev_8_21_14_0_10_36_26]